MNIWEKYLKGYHVASVLYPSSLGIWPDNKIIDILIVKQITLSVVSTIERVKVFLTKSLFGLTLETRIIYILVQILRILRVSRRMRTTRRRASSSSTRRRSATPSDEDDATNANEIRKNVVNN